MVSSALAVLGVEGVDAQAALRRVRHDDLAPDGRSGGGDRDRRPCGRGGARARRGAASRGCRRRAPPRGSGCRRPPRACALSGDGIAASTSATRWAIWVSSSANMAWRACPRPRLTPPPKTRLSHGQRDLAGGSRARSPTAAGATARAAAACMTPWPSFSRVSAASMLAVDFRALLEEGAARRLDAGPTGIALDGVPVLGEPERGGGRHLRRRRRRAGAVHVDELGAADLGPGHVRGVGADRRVHLLGGAVVPLHGAEGKPGVGAAVGHHAAGGEHPAQAGGEHDRLRRGDAGEVVAGGGDEHEPVVVGAVDRVDERLRGHPAHGHREHVRPLGAGVVDALDHRAEPEAHDPVGDAHGDDLDPGAPPR